MKLKNKLIPISAIAGIAAISTPLVLTSCSNSLSGKIFDLSKKYSSKIKAHDAQIMSWKDMNEVYAQEVNKNKNIFIDDFFYSCSQFGNSFDPLILLEPAVKDKNILVATFFIFPYSAKHDESYERMTDVSVGLQEFKVNEADPITNILTVSFTLDFTLSPSTSFLSIALGEGDIPFDITQTEIVCEGKITYKDVPIIITNSDLTFLNVSGEYLLQVPHLIPFMPWMLGDTDYAKCKPWSINFDASLSMTEKNSGITVDMNSQYSLYRDICLDLNSTEYEILEYLCGMSYDTGSLDPYGHFYWSHYLSNIICTDQCPWLPSNEMKGWN